MDIIKKEIITKYLFIIRNNYNESDPCYQAINEAIRAVENAGCGCALCLSHNNMKCPKIIEGSQELSVTSVTTTNAFEII